MRLNDIFEEWDKKRPKTGYRIHKKTVINNFNELDEYTKELAILINRRSALKVTQPMLGKALGCSRESVRNYETRRSQDNWFFIYAAKYVLDQYEWHVRQMEIHKMMAATGVSVMQ